MGPVNVEVFLTLVGSVLAFSWLAVHSGPALFAFSITYGFFAGAITIATAVIDAALCPSLDIIIGVRMGMLLVSWALGLLFGEPVGGAILDSHVGWAGLQVFTGSTLIAATVLCLAVRTSKYGWRIVQKC